MIIILIIFVLTILIWKLVKNSPRTIEYIKYPLLTPSLDTIFEVKPQAYKYYDVDGTAQMLRSNIIQAWNNSESCDFAQGNWINLLIEDDTTPPKQLFQNNNAWIKISTSTFTFNNINYVALIVYFTLDPAKVVGATNAKTNNYQILFFDTNGNLISEEAEIINTVTGNDLSPFARPFFNSYFPSNDGNINFYLIDYDGTVLKYTIEKVQPQLLWPSRAKIQKPRPPVTFNYGSCFDINCFETIYGFSYNTKPVLNYLKKDVTTWPIKNLYPDHVTNKAGSYSTMKIVPRGDTEYIFIIGGYDKNKKVLPYCNIFYNTNQTSPDLKFLHTVELNIERYNCEIFVGPYDQLLWVTGGYNNNNGPVLVSEWMDLSPLGYKDNIDLLKFTKSADIINGNPIIGNILQLTPQCYNNLANDGKMFCALPDEEKISPSTVCQPDLYRQNTNPNQATVCSTSGSRTCVSCPGKVCRNMPGSNTGIFTNTDETVVFQYQLLKIGFRSNMDLPTYYINDENAIVKLPLDIYNRIPSFKDQLRLIPVCSLLMAFPNSLCSDQYCAGQLVWQELSEIDEYSSEFNSIEALWNPAQINNQYIFQSDKEYVPTLETELLSYGACTNKSSNPSPSCPIYHLLRDDNCVTSAVSCEEKDCWIFHKEITRSRTNRSYFPLNNILYLYKLSGSNAFFPYIISVNVERGSLVQNTQIVPEYLLLPNKPSDKISLCQAIKNNCFIEGVANYDNSIKIIKTFFKTIDVTIKINDQKLVHKIGDNGILYLDIKNNSDSLAAGESEYFQINAEIDENNNLQIPTNESISLYARGEFISSLKILLTIPSTSPSTSPIFDKTSPPPYLGIPSLAAGEYRPRQFLFVYNYLFK